MGSNKSTPTRQNLNEQEAHLTSYADFLKRQRAEQAAEKIQWQKQQSLERHWKEQQLHEEQKRKEAVLEWQRLAKLNKLKLQQDAMKKEFEKHKVQQKLEQEKLQKQLEEQRLEKAQLEREKFQKQLKERQLENMQLEQKKLQKQLVEQQLQKRILQKQLEEQRLEKSLSQQVYEREFQQVRTIILPTARSTASLAVKETVAVQQRAPTNIKSILPKLKETQKSYVTRMSELNVKCTEWTIIDYVKDKNNISKKVTENILELFGDGNTIPFVARYRRHMTEGMDTTKLRKVRNSYEQAKLIKQHAVFIVKDIEQKSQWTPEFHALVHETKSFNDLEYIHSVFQTSKFKAAKRATDTGLGIVADTCMKNKPFPPISHLVQEVVEGLKTEEQIKDGIVSLLAVMIINDRRTFNRVIKLQSEHRMEIETKKGKNADKLQPHQNKYEEYYNFTFTESNLKPEQVFTINRGEALKALSVKINIPDKFKREFKMQCLQQYGITGYVQSIRSTLIDAAIDFAYDRSIVGLVAKRRRQEINARAQEAALEDLSENVKQHLLVPPVRGKVIIGISSGFRKGCQLAVISENGEVLETRTIYSHIANNPSNNIDAERVLVRMVCKHRCTIFALGNGIASKETELFLVHVIKNKKIASLDVVYTIVDESGASIYSSSREAALEFPRVKAGIVSAVSIARRLQDPMAELVKIEPELLTVDIYQQDLSKKEMGMKINEIIVEAVSYVGVDANTASVSLLKRVAGLNESKAKSIIEWRRSNGPFTNRNHLLKVRGISKRIFEQCAGFIRIVPETAVASSGQEVSQDSFNFFDQTWIHPESYNVAQSILEDAKCNIKHLGTNSFIFTLNLYAQKGYAVLAKRFGTTQETIEMIIEGLKIPKGQDIRGKADSAMFHKSMIKFNDLSNGTVLTGVVTHLTEFGAFVNVGAEIDGLIHKTSMNGLTVEVNQKVEVRVINISKERGRFGLHLLNVF